jgi:hypothetical protein
MEQENKDKSAHLSTIGGLNPLDVLRQLESDPAVVVVIAVWPRGGQTGLLEERGSWVDELWRTVVAEIASVHGCRLLWNTVFFAVPATNVLRVKEEFRRIIKKLFTPSLESLCVIGEAHGSPDDKLLFLDSMQSEVAAPQNFGTDPLVGHRLRDAQDWLGELPVAE